MAAKKPAPVKEPEPKVEAPVEPEVKVEAPVEPEVKVEELPKNVRRVSETMTIKQN